MDSEKDFVTHRECETCREKIFERMNKDTDKITRHDERIKTIEETIGSIKKIGWFILTTIGATLIVSVLGLILK